MTHKPTVPTNLWFFVGHSIGVTLLAIHTLEAGYFALPKKERGRCFLVVNKKSDELYGDILKMYPHINVVYLDFRNSGTFLKRLLQMIGDRHLVFHPLSFGNTHFLHVLVTWLITRLGKRSEAVRFVRVNTKRSFVFTQELIMNLKKSIFDSLLDAVVSTGLVPYRVQPHLLFERDSLNFLRDARQSYIVLHPFAASVSRSLPLRRWEELVKWILTEFQDEHIIISGGPHDKNKALQLANGSTRVSFIGDLTEGKFNRTIQFIAGSRLYVGVDTGPTHVAAHLRVPCLVIGNNSNPCWLPTYAPSAVVLTESKNCTCTLDKKGECFVEEDGVRYYRCMVEVSDDVIKQNILKNLSFHE